MKESYLKQPYLCISAKEAYLHLWQCTTSLKTVFKLFMKDYTQINLQNWEVSVYVKKILWKLWTHFWQKKKKSFLQGQQDFLNFHLLQWKWLNPSVERGKLPFLFYQSMKMTYRSWYQLNSWNSLASHPYRKPISSEPVGRTVSQYSTKI